MQIRLSASHLIGDVTFWLPVILPASSVLSWIVTLTHVCDAHMSHTLCCFPLVLCVRMRMRMLAVAHHTPVPHAMMLVPMHAGVCVSHVSCLCPPCTSCVRPSVMPCLTACYACVLRCVVRVPRVCVCVCVCACISCCVYVCMHECTILNWHVVITAWLSHVVREHMWRGSHPIGAVNPWIHIVCMYVCMT
jgi:hypothetical protein